MVATLYLKYVGKFMSDVTTLTVAGDFTISLHCVLGN